MIYELWIYELLLVHFKNMRSTSLDGTCLFWYYIVYEAVFTFSIQLLYYIMC